MHGPAKKITALLLSLMMFFTVAPTPVSAKGDGRGNSGWGWPWPWGWGWGWPSQPEEQEPEQEEVPEEENAEEVKEEIPEEQPAEEPEITEETSEPEETVAPEETEEPEQAEEEITEDTTEPEETAAPEETEVPEETAAPEETPVVEEEVKEITYPAQDFSEIKDYFIVEVEAPEGAFPENTKMTVTPVTEDSILSAAEEAVPGEAKSVIALDISFSVEEEGVVTEIEPKGEIKVTIKTADINKDNNYSVVHVDNDNNAEKLSDQKVESDEESITFSSDTFSIYVIVDGGSGEEETFRRTYYFIEDPATGNDYEFINKEGKMVHTQIIKNGDSLEVVGQPYFMGKTFGGWYIAEKNGDTYTLTDTEVTFETAISDVTEDETVYVVPKFEGIFYATFHENAQGSADDVIQTKKVTDAAGNVMISDVIAPQPDETHIFYGWTDGENEYPIYENNTLKETIITIDHNVDLYPMFEEAYWLRFVSGEVRSNASYVPAQFVLANEAVTSLPVPTRKGYTFAGWYTGSQDSSTGAITYEDQISDGSGTVINPASGLMIDQETTLYGMWEANTDAQYKVVIWRQKVTDKKDAPNSEKTYDYAESYIGEGTTGEPAAPSQEDISHSGGEYTGFHYSRTVQTSTVIEANGSTVINVYYDRDLVSVNFYYRDDPGTGEGTVAYEYTPTTSETASPQFGVLPDGSYIELTRESGSHQRVYYTYDRILGGQEEYTNTFYIRTGSIFGVPIYEETEFNGNNLPTNTSITYYARLNALDYRQLTRRTETVADYNWKYTIDGVDYPYTGTRYLRSESGSHPYMVTWTGLYGQSFSQNDYVWPSDYKWNEQENGGGTTQTFLTDFTRTETYNLYDQGTPGKSVIYHYKQGLDGKYSQSEELRYTAYGSGVNFNFENKFTGFTVTSYNTGNNGFNTNGGSNTDLSNTPSTYPLHVYHVRNKWKITYVSEGTTVHESEEIYYEAPLADYNISQEDAGLDDKPHYEFTGWYADETCTQLYNFETGTMPNANVVVYAGWAPVKYRVNVDPNGGILDSSVGSTYFNVEYGDKVTRYELSRTYLPDASGEYKYVFVRGEDDPDGNIKVRTATYETAEAGYEGQRYRPMTADDDVYTLIGWYIYNEDGTKTDTVYDFDSIVEDNVNIYAKWRLSGYYYVNYRPVSMVDDVEVSGEFDQDDADVKYSDGSEIIVQNAPKNVTAGYVFDGWEIVDDQGNTLDDNGGNYYKPGDELVLDAGAWAIRRLIHIQAHYSKLEESDIPTSTTIIIFDANGGKIADSNQSAANSQIDQMNEECASAADENLAYWEWLDGREYEAIKKSKMLVNSATEWPFEFDYELEGSTLMGWNHDQEAANNGEVEFKLGTVFGADNLLDGTNTLYAVWSTSFYVYHSSDNTVEKLTVPTGQPFSIYEKTAKGYLYGGYYSAYGKTTSTDDDIKKLTYTDGKAKDPNGTAYEGGFDCWDGSHVIKTDGTKMVPEGNKVYYLKEVPERYLTPYTHYTYYLADKKLTGLFLISAIDDGNYDSVGIYVFGEGKPAEKITKRLTVKTYNGAVNTKLTVDSIYFNGDINDKSRGYLIYVDGTGYLSETSVTYLPYWVTADGIEVKGIYTRTTKLGATVDDLDYEDKPAGE